MSHFSGTVSLGPNDLDAIEVDVFASGRPDHVLAVIRVGELTVANAHNAEPAGLVHCLRVLADRVDEAHDRWLATNTNRTETPDDPS